MKPKTLLSAVLARLKKDAPFGIAGALLNVFVSKILPALISAWGTNFIFIQITILWGQVPLLFESVWSRMMCSVCVVTIGIGFYILRERKRFLYASLELGVGIATAYNAASKLYSNHETNAALLTLLGSIYITVRACDNYNKAYMAAVAAREQAISADSQIVLS